MMLVLAGMEWKYLLGGVCAALPALAALLLLGSLAAGSGMLVFLNPEADPQGAGYHIYQSLIAVGTGGLTGRGYMEGMQKLFYLPEASTDFIFANIAEELGFSGPSLLCCCLRVRRARTEDGVPIQRSVCTAGCVRDHDDDSAAGVLQHQRGVVAGS